MVIIPIWCQHMERYMCFVHINNDMKLQLFREQSFTPELTQYGDMCILHMRGEALLILDFGTETKVMF